MKTLKKSFLDTTSWAGIMIMQDRQALESIRNTPGFANRAKRTQKLIYKRIFTETPYQPMFSA